MSKPYHYRMFRKHYYRKLAVAALLVLVVALATACSAWTGTGTVVEKEYEQARTVIISTGKTTVPVRKPECFELEIEEDNGNAHELCVDRAIWDAYDDGDRITITEEEVSNG